MSTLLRRATLVYTESAEMDLGEYQRLEQFIMTKRDEVALANEKLWEKEVQQGCGFTIPWLNLESKKIQQYANGQLKPVPKPLDVMSPYNILSDVDGKDVLCLACGGGQQSAVFSLLGAKVTVVDLAQGQLNGDSEAAAHYGYKVSTIHGDMRDLSMLNEQSFDLVYGTAVCYVPDAREVYRQVAKVLKPGGLYRCDWRQPSLHFLVQDGNSYTVAKPYCERDELREDGGMEFRHYMDDIFNGLIELRLNIRQVVDLSRYVKPSPEAPPGTWLHEWTYWGGMFVVVAQKE